MLTVGAECSRRPPMASKMTASPNTAENPQIPTSDVCDQGDRSDPSLDLIVTSTANALGLNRFRTGRHFRYWSG